MFQGFSEKSVAFLAALKANNNRAWFEDHRADFQSCCVDPAMDLIEALAPVAQSLDPVHNAVPKLNKSLRRIHRDTRFSKDKTPYHTHIHIVFWAGDHPNRSPGIHFVLSHDHFGFGAGHWAFAGEGLERYRAAVLKKQHRAALETALQSAARVGCFPGEPELKKVPRGFDAAGSTADFLRRKGIVARSAETAGFDQRLFGPAALDYLTEIMGALAPLDRWIDCVVENGREN